MLGWHIGVHRFADPQLRQHRGDLDSIRALIAARADTIEVPKATDDDPRVAVWQAALGGTDWLTDLVDAGKAAHTTRGGYPESYLIRCEDFRTRLRAGLPNEHTSWVTGPHDVLDPERWLGRTTVDAQQLDDCGADEWLLVEAWDES
jgi:hypothetical protein